jgi:outer membrane protein OmpA-like peptidoglycan-associated protein
VGGHHERTPTTAEPESAELEQLRELLSRPERERIDELEARLARQLEPEAIADVLPDAVALRSARDSRLARALGPTIERGLEEQITRNPGRVAEAIYPVLGPAIRRAISDALAGLAESMNRAIEYSLSWRGLRWRVESWRTGVPFAQVVMRHALVYRVEQVLLVHKATGLPLAHASVSAEAARDSDLVSGMLTAIRDFIGDSFEPEQGSDLRGATVGDVTLFVETGPRAMLAVAVRGQPPGELRQSWQSVLEILHLQFAAQLAAFDGDPAPFEPARPMLEGCLQTVLQTDRAEGRSRAPRLVWTVAVLLLLAVATLGVLGHLRWRSLVREVDDLPGVVVLDASRWPWRVLVHGLRDPLAEDPDALLRKGGVGPSRLRSRWESYLSTEPEIVLARARLALAPPDSVTLALEASADAGAATLRASGSASASWLESAAAAARHLPGIGGVDLSAIQGLLPAELVSAAEAIRRRVVLFALGSADLDAEAQRVVSTAVAELVELERAAGAAGYRLGLELVGRTDDAGASELNQRLSLSRAEVVRDALVAAGAPQELPIVARGIGSEQPLGAGPGETNLDRSVSFAVSLSSDPTIRTP